MRFTIVKEGLEAFCCDCRRLIAAHQSNAHSEVGSADAVILPASSRDETLAAIDSWRAKAPGIRVIAIFCRAAGSHPPELEYFSHGLQDYVSCPWTATDLQLRLDRLLGKRPQAPREDVPSWQTNASLIGSSAIFQKLLNQIPVIARSNASVLLTGETGTGKELIARAIHYVSGRAAKPFVPLNCGAVPDHLFENELFGHAKGAFTDAGAAEKGLLADAEGGTFFFDEIDSLSLPAQVKLLRFLQDREYRPLGATKNIVADLRIVGATNAVLSDLVESRAFREDLFHRLSVITLHVPPLRERIDDIPALAKHFMAKYRGDSSHGECEFADGAIERLMQYHWPGNVRELERVLHRGVILSPSAQITAEDLVE